MICVIFILTIHWQSLSRPIGKQNQINCPPTWRGYPKNVSSPEGGWDIFCLASIFLLASIQGLLNCPPTWKGHPKIVSSPEGGGNISTLLRWRTSKKFLVSLAICMSPTDFETWSRQYASIDLTLTVLRKDFYAQSPWWACFFKLKITLYKK